LSALPRLEDELKEIEVMLRQGHYNASIIMSHVISGRALHEICRVAGVAVPDAPRSEWKRIFEALAVRGVVLPHERRLMALNYMRDVLVHPSYFSEGEVSKYDRNPQEAAWALSLAAEVVEFYAMMRT
jgi:hypothetical protein